MSVSTRLRRYAAVLLLSQLVAGPLAAQPQQAVGPPVRAIKCGRLLDVKAGRVITQAVVLTQGGTMLQAGANVTIPAGAEVIDLGNAFVLPGLIDAHTHLLLNFTLGPNSDDANLLLAVTQGTPRRALLGAAMAREDLEAGITTVRDLGNSGVGGDVALRDALYDGADCLKVIVNTGPRLLSLDELKVIVEEAHRAGKPVAAHAIGNEATRLAAQAGVCT